MHCNICHSIQIGTTSWYTTAEDLQFTLCLDVTKFLMNLCVCVIEIILNLLCYILIYIFMINAHLFTFQVFFNGEACVLILQSNHQT